MTPTTIKSTEGGIHFPDHITKEDFKRDFLINGLPEDSPKVAGWNGHEFETLGGEVGRWQFYLEDNWEQGLIIYYPIDPRMTEEDIKGATLAYPNATNDGWLFAHCDADFHLDQEVRIKADIISLFQPGLDVRMSTVITARDTLQTAALEKWQKVVDFRSAVINRAETNARNVHLGWYHQNPHESHLHSLILSAIEGTKEHWDNTPALKYSTVSGVVDPIIHALKNPHPYETRWDMAARLEAEKKAKDTVEPPEE